MAKADEISSTERLLDLIRQNDGAEPNVAGTSGQTPQPTKKRVGSYLTDSLSFKKPVTIGIDIGYNDLKLVKIDQTSQPSQMIDYLQVPFEPDVTMGHPNFSDFLRSTLNRFCGDTKSVEIWSNISSARVELRYVTIPKVSVKQIPNAVYWSHRRVAPFNEKEAVFDYQIIGDLIEEGAPRIAAVSFTAPKLEIQTLRTLFSKCGYPLTGISIVPFALQNILKSGWIKSETNVSSLYIGRDWSRIDIFSDGNLMVSRGIKAGMRTMIEAMREGLGLTPSESPSDTPADAQESSFAIPRPTSDAEFEKAQQIFYNLIHENSDVSSQATALEPTEKTIFRSILPALDRLVRQVELTFDHFGANFDSKGIHKIYISSTGHPNRRIINYIGRELGIASDTLDPFNIETERLGDVIGPESPTERGTYTPAVGIALSNNEMTPNFLYTFKEKAKVRYVHRLVRFATVGFILLLGLCFGYYTWQSYKVEEKQTRIYELRNQLESFRARVNQNMILELVSQTKENNELFKSQSQRYKSIVVLTEISNITPTNIRLRRITVDLGEKANSANGDKAAPVPQKTAVLEGLVFGARNALEAALANYLIGLRNSPMFEQPVIDKKSLGTFDEMEVLQFTVTLKIA